MTKQKRKIVLVDKGTQWAIVNVSLRHWLYHSLVTILVLAVLQVLLGGVFKPWREHWQSIWPLAASVYVALLIVLPPFILDSFRLSNRFAGPIARVRRALRDIADGKPHEPIEFRQGDFWPEMAEELNAAVEALANQRKSEERELETATR
jgi:hypothetical protein